MGFTISDYSLFGLQPQSFYVSIRGSFTITKLPGFVNQLPYRITYTVYYSSSKESQAITQQIQLCSLEELPEPANIYPMIYSEIKKTINPDNILTITDDDS